MDAREADLLCPGQKGPAGKRIEDCHGQFKERLMRLVIRRLYRGQKDHAESVVQTILMSYVGHLRQAGPEPTKEEDQWEVLYRIALRHCDKHRKRASREKKAGKFAVQFSQRKDQDGDHDHPGPASDRVLEDWVEHIVVRLEQKDLDEQELAVFQLMLGGHTIEEIAKLTGLKVGRVRAVSAVIKRTIQSCFEEVQS